MLVTSSFCHRYLLVLAVPSSCLVNRKLCNITEISHGHIIHFLWTDICKGVYGNHAFIVLVSFWECFFLYICFNWWSWRLNLLLVNMLHYLVTAVNHKFPTSFLMWFCCSSSLLKWFISVLPARLVDDYGLVIQPVSWLVSLNICICTFFFLYSSLLQHHHNLSSTWWQIRHI